MSRVLLPTLSLLFVSLGSACSTVIGNVKPVDEKSEDYSILDLTKDPAKLWLKLDPRAVAAEGESGVDPKNDAFESEVSDLTFQSKKTAAIISLNSACRRGRDGVNLLGFSQELTLGLTGVTERHEQEVVVDGRKALQTTVEGTLGGERTRIRTVVLQNGTCIYDLMYVSRPARFPVHEADFTRFVSSLRLR